MKLFGLTILSTEDFKAYQERIAGLERGTEELRRQRDKANQNYRDAMDIHVRLDARITAAEQNKALIEGKLLAAQTGTQNQLARINNTNDKLRTFGKALTVFGAHLSQKPISKAPPKTRQDWNTKFDELWTNVAAAQVTRVTDYAQLSQKEKDEAAAPMKGV